MAYVRRSSGLAKLYSRRPAHNLRRTTYRKAIRYPIRRPIIRRPVLNRYKRTYKRKY